MKTVPPTSALKGGLRHGYAGVEEALAVRFDDPWSIRKVTRGRLQYTGFETVRIDAIDTGDVVAFELPHT